MSNVTVLYMKSVSPARQRTNLTLPLSFKVSLMASDAREVLGLSSNLTVSLYCMKSNLSTRFATRDMNLHVLDVLRGDGSKRASHYARRYDISVKPANRADNGQSSGFVGGSETQRERRERQKRVFRMSLLIISTFLLCWTPITVLNSIILSTGPSDLNVKLRLGLLVMAYGTTVFHPLLSFTRQKFQKVLKSKMKKRVVSYRDRADAHNSVIKNSWIDPKKNKKVTFEDHEAKQKCLSSEDVD
ncbi:putative G-protein coupled receptor 22 [Bagarius yarrelli]|uniref:Putative G-protein coupled receptor 22 n=1 Tax=Bagarius yarrelli TaxID=175774 RepID=A0A556U412_BAGYA|nr:putative G-protein coupled receptor 22 [Bagarius yarrelli]